MRRCLACTVFHFCRRYGLLIFYTVRLSGILVLQLKAAIERELHEQQLWAELKGLKQRHVKLFHILPRGRNRRKDELFVSPR